MHRYWIADVRFMNVVSFIKSNLLKDNVVLQ